jgi:hypothetical protein
MQLSSIVFCLLAASMALAKPADPAPGSGCPGGYAEGAEIERGRLVYVCQGGAVVPKACIAEDLSKIPVGGNYDNKNYRRKCVAAGDQLTFEATGCLRNGQEHKAEELFDDGTNFFKCKLNAAGAEPQMVVSNEGCVDSGKRINKKDKVAKEDALYECQETVNDGSKLVQVGCVKDGKQYNAGDAFEVGKYWYNCTRTGREKVVAKAAGCVASGKRLNDGDRYTENDIFYECTVDGGKTDVRATGCAQTDGGSVVERRLGCTWVEGTEPFQYEWMCKHDAAANTAVKVQVRCNYKVGSGVYNIDPGCYRVVEKAAFGCVQDGKNLKLQSFQGDNAEQAASGAGLHAC